MKFEFKINKYYLVGQAIASKIKPFPAWKKLEEKIWGKYKEEPAYYFLNPKHIKWAMEKMQMDFLTKNINEVFQKNALKLEKIYKDIFETSEFKKLLKETQNYLHLTEKRWNRKQKNALDFIAKKSGIKIPNKKFTIFLTHPKLHNGRAITEKDIIVWGHPEEWKNYTVVYLCHELMHFLTWDKQKNPLIMHAIIELLTDNELKIFLGQNKKEKNQGVIGHKNLLSLRKKILPYWINYSKNPTNIFNLEKEIIKRIPPKKVREG